MSKYFKIPFALSGERVTIPELQQSGGEVSYTIGYGNNYQLPLTTAGALAIERTKMNELFYEITLALAELRKRAWPEYISPTDNGGTTYTYQRNDIVQYYPSAGPPIYYRSILDNNRTVPGAAGYWVQLDLDNISGNAATATKAANALGVGQSQINMTTGQGEGTNKRNQNVTYTNQTGRSILVTVTIQLYLDGQDAYFRINGFNAALISFRGGTLIGPSCITMLVADGENYGVFLNGGDNTINSWTERR